jgi:hypothetical protein
VNYVDGDGGIIVPRSVRPIIDYEETCLGDKKGAKKQFRYGKLHIREYKDYLIVHMDKVDPGKDPLGHLLVDAPEYLVSAFAGLEVAKLLGAAVRAKTTRYTKRKETEEDHLMLGLKSAILIGTASVVSSWVVRSVFRQFLRRT